MSHPIPGHDAENELPEDIISEEDREEIRQDHLQGDANDARRAEVEASFTSEEDHNITDPDSIKYPHEEEN